MQKQLTKRQAEVLTELIKRYGATEGKWFDRYEKNSPAWSLSAPVPYAASSVFRALEQKGTLIPYAAVYNCFARYNWRLNHESEFVKSIKANLIEHQ